MTLSASWSEVYPGNVTVRCTAGPVTFEVVEDRGGAAAFWSDLGRVLAADPAHVAAQARRGYGLYRDHANGKSVNGEDIPLWDNASPEVQDHWIAAFSG